MPLTNRSGSRCGSGCGSGSFYFYNWPSRCQQKTNLNKKISQKEVTKQYKSRVFLLLCLKIEGSGSGSIRYWSGSRRPINTWIRIRIRNTGFIRCVLWSSHADCPRAIRERVGDRLPSSSAAFPHKALSCHDGRWDSQHKLRFLKGTMSRDLFAPLNLLTENDYWNPSQVLRIPFSVIGQYSQLPISRWLQGKCARNNLSRFGARFWKEIQN
jgi:hypothetical protein